MRSSSRRCHAGLRPPKTGNNLVRVVLTALTTLVLAVSVASRASASAPIIDDWNNDGSQVSNTITVPSDADISDMFAPIQVTALSPEAVAEREEAERVADLVEQGLWRWYDPVPGGSVTSRYGFRPAIEEIGLDAGLHPGVDLAAPLGSEVVAAFAGTVTYVGEGFEQWGVSGWVVVVDHGLIDGHTVRTGYNHMSQEGVLVTDGQLVDPGELIALVGNEGRSTGPHLHLTLEVDGQVVDPEPWFAQVGAPL